MIWHCFLYWHVDDWNRQEELDKSVGRIKEHPSCTFCVIAVLYICIPAFYRCQRPYIFLEVIYSSAKIPGLNIFTFSLVFWTQRFLIDFGKQYCGNIKAIPSCPGIEVSIISYRLAFRSLLSALTVL